MSSYKKISIADVLRAVKYNPEPDNGICTQKLVRLWLSPSHYATMKEAISEWPKRSDCRVYPVPASNGNQCPSLAQMEYHRRRMDNKSLWDASTEYGALRYELLDWLIKHPDLQKPLWKRG